jgi:ubiquinone/menaquinone biosynthesis C-methylase UbiE
MKFLKRLLKPLVEIFKQPINEIIHRRELPPLFSFLDSLPSPPRVLEVGCGRGYSLPIIIEHFHPQKIVVFDLDREELKEAEKLKREKQMENVEIRELDATSLPFPDGSFDLILVSAVLHHIKEWRKAVSEASRVLAPGGYMILKEPLKKSFEVKPINPFYKWYDGPVSLFTEQEVRKSLEDNKLSIKFWEYRGLYGRLFKCSFRAVCQKA